MGKSKFIRLIENLLWPPKCVGCGELCQKHLFDTCELPLCDRCRGAWEREKLEICPDCDLEMTICNCSSRLLEKAEVEDAVKLFNYSTRRNGVGKHAVLYMKKHRNPRAIEFFATQLSYAVKRKVAGADPQKVVVFSVPRSRKSRRVYGLDQAELLAEKLAEVCGFRYLKLIKRSRNSGAAQKKKNLSKRVKDAKTQFAPDLKQIKLLGDAELIVAVDDILTSGASLAGCIEKLKKYYKGKFICATVGRTGKRRKK